MSKTKSLKTAVFLIYIFLGIFLAFVRPSSVSATCVRYTINSTSSMCLTGTHCPAPIDHLCCDSMAECDLQNPFCGGPGGSSYIKTAIGCLRVSDPTYFVNQILGWGITLAAGIAFLVLIYGGFLIATSTGDANRVKMGQQYLLSALAGLVLIAISTLLLNFIGVKILGINPFGFVNP